MRTHWYWHCQSCQKIYLQVVAQNWEHRGNLDGGDIHWDFSWRTGFNPGPVMWLVKGFFWKCVKLHQDHVIHGRRHLPIMQCSTNVTSGSCWIQNVDVAAVLSYSYVGLYVMSCVSALIKRISRYCCCKQAYTGTRTLRTMPSSSAASTFSFGTFDAIGFDVDMTLAANNLPLLFSVSSLCIWCSLL